MLKKIEQNSFLVGGAVRDAMLGLPQKDKDWVVVGINREQMLEAGFNQVGADFPVFLHPSTHEEYALARKERKTGSGYSGFECEFGTEVRLEEDLLRRDLTINAMALDANQKLIDPYGGEHDLKQKQLRHVSQAFSEDPLRILRLARFYARFKHLGFQIHTSTQDLCLSMSNANELEHLSAERVWQETERALSEHSPSAYFLALHNLKALTPWFTELEDLFGIPQPAAHHPEIDTGIHALLSLEQACTLSKKPSVRWAALLHDLGKALTPKNLLPKHHGHEQNGIEAINNLNSRLKAPKEMHELSRLTGQWHTHVHRAFELKPVTLLKLFNALDVWRRPERFEDFLLACMADAKGREGFENKPYPQADYCRSALKAAQEVQAKSIIEQGFKGAQIGEQLQQTRIQRLKVFKAGYN